MRRVAFPVLVLAIGLLAGGCFGPVVSPTADFTVCPDGADGLLAYWLVSQSSTVPGHYLTSFVWTLGDGTVVETTGGRSPTASLRREPIRSPSRSPTTAGPRPARPRPSTRSRWR